MSDFLTKLSAQMGTHLHNAMFFDQYTEDRVRMRALLRMAKRVTPAEQDTVSALRTTVQEFKRIVDSERCSVYACLAEQETMVLYTDLMEGWTAPIAMPISVGIAGMVAATGKLTACCMTDGGLGAWCDLLLPGGLLRRGALSRGGRARLLTDF